MASELIFNVSDDNFKAEVLESATPVLVDFWAPWCGPCRAIAPIVEEVAKDFNGRLKVVKVNTDDSVDVAAQYAIRSIPTLMVFKGGKVANQLVGAVPKAKVLSFITNAL